jgi:hypothetical protein
MVIRLFESVRIILRNPVCQGRSPPESLKSYLNAVELILFQYPRRLCGKQVSGKQEAIAIPGKIRETPGQKMSCRIWEKIRKFLESITRIQGDHSFHK